MSSSTYLKGGIVALLVAGFAGYLATRSHETGSQVIAKSRDLPRASGSSELSDDSASPSAQGGQRLPSRKMDRTADETAKLELGIARLEEEVKGLKSRELAEKIPYAAYLPFPNNPVKPLFEQYGQERMKMMSLKESGLGSNHPGTIAQQKIIDSMSRDLIAAVDRLDDQMETELNASQEALLRLRSKR